MKHLVVPYEIALNIKEKGFNEPCLGYYGRLDHDFYYCRLTSVPYRNESFDIISAPMYQQVIDWFEEKHKIKIDIHHADSNGTNKFTIWKWNYDNQIGKWERLSYLGTYETKKECTEKAIKESLKLINN